MPAHILRRLVILTLILPLVLIGMVITANSGTASSRSGVWAAGQGWTIEGNTQKQSCSLVLNYMDGGSVFLVVANQMDPVFGFIDRNIRPLARNFEVVEASVSFSNGNGYNLVALVLQEDTIAARTPISMITDFARAGSFELRVRGVKVDGYRLTGTNQMVAELMVCFQAMLGDPT